MLIGRDEIARVLLFNSGFGHECVPLEYVVVKLFLADYSGVPLAAPRRVEQVSITVAAHIVPVFHQPGYYAGKLFVKPASEEETALHTTALHCVYYGIGPVGPRCGGKYEGNALARSVALYYSAVLADVAVGTSVITYRLPACSQSGKYNCQRQKVAHLFSLCTLQAQR